MQPNPEARPNRVHPLLTKATTVILAIVAIGTLCMAMFHHWRSFAGVDKFLGTALIFNVLVVSWTETRNKRIGRKEDPYSTLQIGYTWLLLAAMLFNRV